MRNVCGRRFARTFACSAGCERRATFSCARARVLACARRVASGCETINKKRRRSVRCCMPTPPLPPPQPPLQPPLKFWPHAARCLMRSMALFFFVPRLPSLAGSSPFFLFLLASSARARLLDACFLRNGRCRKRRTPRRWLCRRRRCRRRPRLLPSDI